MKIANRKIILLIIIIIILVLIGLFLFLNRNKSNNVPNNAKESIYEVNNFIIDNFDLKKEHCTEHLCIKDLTIYYDRNDISTVKYIIYNNSTETINKCFKIMFNNSDDDPWEIAGCYSNFGSQKELNFEYQFDYEVNSIIDIDNYKIIEITKEEAARIKEKY